MSKRWVACDMEEEFFGDERKQSKIDRKIAQAKDRSKYKKTDKAKFLQSVKEDQKQKVKGEHSKRGRVISIVPEGIMVAYEDTVIACHLRGILKKERTQSKNLVTVGDYVLFEEYEDGFGVIAQVEPRQSVLSRADNLSRRKEQLIASNIDQVIITVSVVQPALKASLVDRYIIAAKKGNMAPIIAITKVDLLEDDDVDPVLREVEEEILEMMLQTYPNLGIPIVLISNVTGEGIDELKLLMKDKSSVFSGQSGVGKSSLINAVTGLDIRVGAIVDKTKKGAHTTTTTNLLPLSFGGWCIDTPGIKSFGVWDLEKQELDGYFTEINAIGRGCKFPNCSHLHEESCAVKDALESGELSPLRYESYQSLLASISSQHIRR